MLLDLIINKRVFRGKVGDVFQVQMKLVRRHRAVLDGWYAHFRSLLPGYSDTVAVSNLMQSLCRIPAREELVLDERCN